MSIIKVKTGGITADAVTDALIADDVVGTEHLTAGEVDATALGADSVTAAKINDDIISGTTALASEPADTDEFLVSDAGTLKRIDYSLIKSGGLTMADQWRLTTSFTGDATISSNLERVDTYGYGQLGTGMTESSGAFTFPSTGIYYISFSVTQKNGDNSTKRFNASKILTTTDNSTYNTATETYQGIPALNSDFYGFMSSNFIFDVTNTTTHKVKFSINAFDSGVATEGSTDTNHTFMTFLKLGGT